MNEDRLWSLLALKLAGEASEEEVRELDIILKENPGMQQLVDTFIKIWNASKPASNETAAAYARHLRRLKK
jgi:hypothetical protein